MRVIQPSTRSTLGEYDSRPPLARYVCCVTWYLRSSCCSETHYAHVKLPVFLPLSTLDVTHMRKCTRPSPSPLYRTKQRQKAGRGTGNEATFSASRPSNIQSISVVFEDCVLYCVTMCNFLWVELHGNDTTWNTQESESHAGTLRVIFTVFRENPRNTQCSNAREIDCTLISVPLGLLCSKLLLEVISATLSRYRIVTTHNHNHQVSWATPIHLNNGPGAAEIDAL